MSEQPQRRIPEDNAPSTKYFTPDSDDCNESLFIAAMTYNDRLCNSIPKYIDIKLFEAIKTIMPRVENKIKIGISNFCNFKSLKKLIDIDMVTMLPRRIKILKKRINCEDLKRVLQKAKDKVLSFNTDKLTAINNIIDKNEIFLNTSCFKNNAIKIKIKHPDVRSNSGK